MVAKSFKTALKQSGHYPRSLDQFDRLRCFLCSICWSGIRGGCERLFIRPLV